MKELRSRPKFDYQFDTLNLIDKLFYSELKRRNKIIKEKSENNSHKIKKIDIKIIKIIKIVIFFI